MDDDLKVKTTGSTCRIILDGKEIMYSHQNILLAIHSFLPYLTNDDLTELGQDILDLMKHREEKEALSKLEVKQHSWPYPDTKQSVIQEHEMSWGAEYEDKS